MNIVVTGGSGFVGRIVRQKLVTAEDTVHFPTHTEADLRSVESLTAYRGKIGPVDQLVHLAGYVPKESDENLAAPAHELNVAGTQNLLAVFGAELRSLIFVSTAEVYAAAATDTALTEASSVAPRSPYAASKREAEKLCEAYAAEHHVPLTVLRLTTLYGPQDPIHRAISNFVASVKTGTPIRIHGTGTDVRDYLHVEDAAAVTVQAMQQKTDAGIVNVASGRGVTINELAVLIQHAGGTQVPVEHDGEPQPPTYLRFDIRKAQEVLGFTPSVPLEQGLQSLFT
jgi:UDP-glucose 4-epimerase